jgi:hypothetical protein
MRFAERATETPAEAWPFDVPARLLAAAKSALGFCKTSAALFNRSLRFPDQFAEALHFVHPSIELRHPLGHIR